MSTREKALWFVLGMTLGWFALYVLACILGMTLATLISLAPYLLLAVFLAAFLFVGKKLFFK